MRVQSRNIYTLRFLGMDYWRFLRGSKGEAFIKIYSLITNIDETTSKNRAVIYWACSLPLN